MNWLNYISSSLNGYVLTYGNSTVTFAIAIYLLRRYKKAFSEERLKADIQMTEKKLETRLPRRYANQNYMDLK
jgi:hypothetical protein